MNNNKYYMNKIYKVINEATNTRLCFHGPPFVVNIDEKKWFFCGLLLPACSFHLRQCINYDAFYTGGNWTCAVVNGRARPLTTSSSDVFPRGTCNAATFLSSSHQYLRWNRLTWTCLLPFGDYKSDVYNS